MNFNFLHIKLNTPIEEYKDNLKFLSTDNGVMLYEQIRLEKTRLFGYEIRSIFLFFFDHLICVGYKLFINHDEYPDFIDCITLATASKPELINEAGQSFMKWKSSLETLYCFPNYEQQEIQLYHVNNKYDVM